MPNLALAAFLVASLGLLAPVHAHVGSSDSVNNRYYKLTPMADRVRIAYTIFFGREPGLVARRRMDSDRDGQLSPTEISSYGQVIANELIKSVSVDLDERAIEVLWKDVDMGIGSPSVGGGPFSVDLIGTVCLRNRSPEHEHQFLFRDRMRLPKPGESELSVAPAPGIRVTQSVLGGKAAGQSEKWQGGPGPAQTGYLLGFVVQSDETGPLDSDCQAKQAGGRSRWLYVLIAGLGLLALWVGLRRRRPRATR